MFVVHMYVKYWCCALYTVVSQAKRPLPGKHPSIGFQGVTVAASMQTHGIYITGKRPCGPKLQVMFKRQWALTRDVTVHVLPHC